MYILIFFTHLYFVYKISTLDGSSTQGGTCPETQKCPVVEPYPQPKPYCYESIDHQGSSKLILTFNRVGREPPPAIIIQYKISNNHADPFYVSMSMYGDPYISYIRTNKTCPYSFKVTGQSAKDLAIDLYIGKSLYRSAYFRIKFDAEATDQSVYINDTNSLFKIRVDLERNGAAIPTHSLQHGSQTKTNTVSGNLISVCAVGKTNAYDLQILFPQNKNYHIQRIVGIQIRCTDSYYNNINLGAWECNITSFSRPLTIVYPCNIGQVGMKILYGSYEDQNGLKANRNYMSKGNTGSHHSGHDIHIYNMNLQSLEDYKKDPTKKLNEQWKMFAMQNEAKTGTCPQYGQDKIVKISVFNQLEKGQKDSIEAYLLDVHNYQDTVKHYTTTNFTYFDDETGCTWS